MPRGFVNKRDRFKWDNVHEPEGEFPVQASNVVTGEDETLDEALTALDDRIDQTQEDMAAALYVTGTVTGSSGVAVEITDGQEGSKLLKCLVTFGFTQTGSSDPSPSNVRPIIGYDSIKVTRSKADTDDDVHTVQMGAVRYAGTLDLVSGIMTITKAPLSMLSADWTLVQGSESVFTTSTSSTRTGNLISCTTYKPISSSVTVANMANLTCKGGTGANVSRIYVKNTTYETADAFTASLTNDDLIVYELADPVQIELTPEEITMLSGSVSFDAECLNGTDSYDPVSLEIKYQRDFNTAIQNLLDAASNNREAKAPAIETKTKED